MKNRPRWRATRFRQNDTTESWTPDDRVVGIQSLYIARLQIRAYQGVIEEHITGRMLDCGCGDVPYFGIYRDRVSSVVCVDWPKTYHASTHVDCWVDLNRSLPFADGTFDSVLLSDVLEHLRHPLELVREIRRILAPGGRIVAMVPFLYWLHEEPHDYFRFSKHGLRAMCADAGLEVIFLQTYGGGPDVLADVCAKLLMQRPRLGKIALRLLSAASRLRMFARAREQWSDVLPLGYCLVAQAATKPRRPAGESRSESEPSLTS